MRAHFGRYVAEVKLNFVNKKFRPGCVLRLQAACPTQDRGNSFSQQTPTLARQITDKFSFSFGKIVYTNGLFTKQHL